MAVDRIRSTSDKKTRKKAGAPRDRQQLATAIAKATGLRHIKQWELGRKNATAGSFCAELRSTFIDKSNLVDDPLFLPLYFSIKLSLFLVR